jgi:hypothetical protein
LLGLGDFPGQGTAPVGVLDAFWEEKGYVAPAEWRRFCASTVPLARLGRRVFETGDTLRADIELAHHGPAALENAVAEWKLVAADAGKETRVAEGRLALPRVETGALTALGRAEAALDASMLADGGSARKLTLVASVESAGGSARFENDWDVWLYPKNGYEERGPALVCDRLDDTAEAALRDGGAVLLAIPPGRARGDARHGRVELGFTSIFWNTSWTNRQAPHTLGILCDPAHPALAGFPTESHSNWQWWHVVSRADAMILDGLPAELQPVAQVVDDWFTNRKLALIFECRVGAGRLLVCSVDLREGPGAPGGANPVVRQLRASLLRYAAGADFAPKVELTAGQVRGLFAR